MLPKKKKRKQRPRKWTEFVNSDNIPLCYYDDKDMEDNNDDLSYINCRLLLPSSIFAVISIAAILIGTILGHFYDIKRKEDGSIPSWLFASGWYSKYCTNLTSTMIPDWYLPSVLRLLELTVQANVSFRIAVCIPTSLRLFQSYLNAIINERFCPHTKEWLWYRWCNNAVPILLLFEISFCTIFAINTIRQDYQILYKLSFNLFIISALLHMIACTAVTIYRKNEKIQTIDQICLIVKLLCLIAFGIVTPQVTIFHNTFIDSPACHYYVPPYQALCEYILIISNALFHLTMITDTRNFRFLIYPRTCSGECEPVNPENFRKGGKFEHCRSKYHLNKKKLMDNMKMKETTF
uniref:CWH43-like N-terminal domain-containing protein n=1 Tax=Wuchereria bancrofti TaxID=6293 RepID=A0A1I8EG14_WUCBA